jgi:Protein of unknown function (DUF3313)
MRLVTLCVLISAASLVGCASQSVEHSGFLNDYSQLKPSPRVEGTMIYENPAKPLRAYDKFILDPVVVHFAPNAKGVGIDPDTLNELAKHFNDEVTKALTEGGYGVVAAPGPGVLHLRAAITEIDKTVPVANIHPAMKMSGLGLGGASMEAEGLDSQSNERVFAVVDSQKGSRMDFVGGLQTYGNAKAVMNEWAKRFVQQLDEVHGRAKK